MHLEAVAFGLILLMQAWAGVNDGGNLLASAVGARTVPVERAFVLLFAAVLAGPLVLGTGVAWTVARTVVALPSDHLAVGLMGAMSGAVASVLVAYSRRVPTSLSLAVVGGLVGSALALGTKVYWAGVARVVVGLLTALGAGFVLGWLCHAGMLALGLRLRRSQGDRLLSLQHAALVLQGLAYGANDAEKALGLLAWSVAGNPRSAAHIPFSLVFVSAAAWLLGAVAGGSRVAASVGLRIFRMRPLHALSVQGSAGITVALAALFGFPVSTTQTVDAALMGVGTVEHPRRVHWRVVGDMALALGITGPVALCLAFAATRLLV